MTCVYLLEVCSFQFLGFEQRYSHLHQEPPAEVPGGEACDIRILVGSVVFFQFLGLEQRYSHLHQEPPAEVSQRAVS